jgi:hypothetical protein
VGVESGRRFSHSGPRVGVSTQDGDPYYIFLLLPKPDNVSEDEYREKRSAVLEAYCLVVKHKFPNAEDIIGFATESGRREYGSEDLLYFDARQWNEEDQKLAEYYHNEVGLIKVVNKFTGTEYEFPTGQKKKRKRHRSRNR